MQVVYNQQVACVSWSSMELPTEVNLEMLPRCRRPRSWSEWCRGRLPCFPTQEAACAVAYHLLYIRVYVGPPHCVPAALLYLDHTQVPLVPNSPEREQLPQAPVLTGAMLL